MGLRPSQSDFSRVTNCDLSGFFTNGLIVRPNEIALGLDVFNQTSIDFFTDSTPAKDAAATWLGTLMLAVPFDSLIEITSALTGPRPANIE